MPLDHSHEMRPMKCIARSITVYVLAFLAGVQLLAQQSQQERQNRQERPDPQGQLNQSKQPNQRSQPNPAARIKQDDTPLPEDVKARTSFAPVAKKVAPSVVNVYSTRQVPTRAPVPFFNDPLFRRFFGGEGLEPRPRTQEGLGSGVIVSEDGYIITNHHVVDEASEIRVATVSGSEYPARVVGTDPATDIAVLKVDQTGLQPLVLADSTKLEVGDTVLAVGNPFGIGQTVTVGIISGLGRGMGIVDYEDFIQTDASINPGNSGGALTDVLGRLVGVNTAILSRTGGNQGVGFAVPEHIVRNVMDQIIRNGHVTRGYMGVYIQPLTPELAKAFNVEVQKGALVASVSPRSPAADAGLKEGDVITEFNGKEITDSRNLRLLVAQTPPGTKAPVKFLRDGKEQQAQVTLGELETEELAQGTGSRGPSTGSARSGVLEGVQITELTPQIRRQLGIPNEVEGVIITEVEPGSAAERAGLEPGAVIEEVNRKPVRSLQDAIASLRRSEENGAVLLRVWKEGATRYVVLDQADQPTTKERP